MAELVHNRFKLLKKCGSGGTGEVHQALDVRLKRLVALKRVRKGSRGDRREKSQRLLKEAEHMALAQHPNVVTVHDVIEEEDSVSIIMEFVEGVAFRELYRKQPVGERELLSYIHQLAAALECAHGQGIIHRDVNPRNVLVRPDGFVKLTDFGLSASANDPEPRAGGTLGYMAPEALRRRGRIGFGVDIYGLGMLAYQALLGASSFQKLYGTVQAADWARWLLSREKFKTLAELKAPVSQQLSSVVEKMLEKDPRRRHQKIADVKRDLENIGGETHDAPAPARGPSLASAVRKLIPALLARPQEKKPR